MNKFEAFEGLSDEWIDLLDDGIDEVLEKLTDATPTVDKIFEFARVTELSNIKVVILGQDPYANGNAHGLAFSSLTDIPASLKNIYANLLKHKLIKEIPNTGDLTPWAEQGVLLLNCSLTTKINTTNAHENLWKAYINKVIGKISNVKNVTPLIFMLWGIAAKNKIPYINSNCHILTHTHPSPQNGNSFLTCDHFIQANDILRKYKQKINWNLVNFTNYELEFGYTSINKNNRVVVFTDGSAHPNKICPDAIAGYGALFALGIYKDTQLYGNIENRPHYATNQRAEGAAILKTLQFLHARLHQWEECIIVSDSEFWIKMFIEYMPQWYAQDIDFKDKKNSDMTVVMWDLFSELKDASKTIEFRHLRSHNKEGWNREPVDSYKYFCYVQNDYVDKLANYARKKLKPGVHEVDKAEYE